MRAMYSSAAGSPTTIHQLPGGGLCATVQERAVALPLYRIQLIFVLMDFEDGIDDVVHVPLLPQTKHMISSKEIGMMKRGAYLINAARGGVVDERALKEALTDGRLAGAALDVYEKEPPKDTSLTGLESVASTPHIGAATEEAQRANSTIVAEKLIKFLTQAEG